MSSAVGDYFDQNYYGIPDATAATTIICTIVKGGKCGKVKIILYRQLTWAISRSYNVPTRDDLHRSGVKKSKNK